MSKEEEPVHYTARHLLQALNNLEDNLLDRPLVLIHGKDLTKPNLVSGIIPAPIPVDQTLVEGKKPSLLALADLLLNPVANGKPPSLTGVDEKGHKIEKHPWSTIEMEPSRLNALSATFNGSLRAARAASPMSTSSRSPRGRRTCTRATTKSITSSQERARSRSARRFIRCGPAAWP